MTIGQLRNIAELSTLQAFIADNPQARIALLRIAHEAASKEAAIARWRGDCEFIRFVPPLHAFAEGQSLCGWDWPQLFHPDIGSLEEKCDDDDATIPKGPVERLCA